MSDIYISVIESKHDMAELELSNNTCLAGLVPYGRQRSVAVATSINVWFCLVCCLVSFLSNLVWLFGLVFLSNKAGLVVFFGLVLQ